MVDEAYLKKLKNKDVLAGYMQFKIVILQITMVNNRLIGYDWKDMLENGRQTYWHNNEVAGEVAVM